jgi:hypothetical protein
VPSAECFAESITVNQDRASAVSHEADVNKPADEHVVVSEMSTATRDQDWKLVEGKVELMEVMKM